MTIVVGFAPDGRGTGALHLAGMLGRSAGENLVVCAIVPLPWPPGVARVDAEYQAYLAQAAQEALDHARERLPGGAPAEFVVHHARSAPAGILEVADRHGADVVVAGSSTAGHHGHVALGSTTDRLLHSSHVPVALATRGFRCPADGRVRRVTAAYGGSHRADDLVVGAAGVAARVGASLRIVSFAVRAHPPYTSGVGTSGERSVLQEWAEEVEAAARGAIDQARRLPAAPAEVEAVIGHGRNWDEALEDVEWADGDVLVVGSSAIGPLARVFLGSRASKIVRHSPVPVVVVPRGAVAELAEEAESGTG
jgi:nucleotide-binding universal stress UspA family protein